MTQHFNQPRRFSLPFNVTRLAKWLLVGTVFLYLYVPIVVLVVNGFNAHKYGTQWRGFTLKWFEKLWQNDNLMDAAAHSLIVAMSAASLATVLGALGAIALYRYDFRGKRFMGGLVFVEMMTPDIVLAIAFLLIFMALGISLGFWSLLLAHTSFCLPFTLITVYSRLNNFDHAVLDAARDLGASEWTAMRKILIPMSAPALMAGWLLSFTLSLDDVIVSSFVSGPGYEILPIRVFSLIKVGVSPEVNVLATLMLVLSLTLVLLSQWLLKRK
ncbi:MAG TPA: spermidine/putrescine ABC transporter permease PotC [Dongiaceae bacterium]|nr:spermidine/putrescine ABC transporter permease PotC [Dongiaceae bacterium]